MASVLVLDDDSHIVFIVSEFLSINGHTVIRATDPADALAKIETFKVGLAILDYNMPSMSGTAVLKKIRRLGWGARLPVIFLTGVDPAKFSSEIVGPGKVKFLAKPVDFSQLTAAVGEMLG